VTRNTPKMSFSQGAYIAKINGASAKYAVFDKRTGEPHHWLVKQVTIPARLKFRETFESYIPEVEKAVRWDLYQALQKNTRN
jgi:UDP-glucose 4-epimerase